MHEYEYESDRLMALSRQLTALANRIDRGQAVNPTSEMREVADELAQTAGAVTYIEKKLAEAEERK